MPANGLIPINMAVCRWFSPATTLNAACRRSEVMGGTLCEKCARISRSAAIPSRRPLLGWERSITCSVKLTLLFGTVGQSRSLRRSSEARRDCVGQCDGNDGAMRYDFEGAARPSTGTVQRAVLFCLAISDARCYGVFASFPSITSGRTGCTFRRASEAT